MKRPATIDEAAASIREHAAQGHVVRVRGGGSKLNWRGDRSNQRLMVDVETTGLCGVVEHNAGDFTAVLEAGITLQAAQAVFAQAGQMLALDPPLGPGASATLGGILATNDSGPQRHRYGALRDLVIGVTVILSDGSIASSGGRVIKNVAGYDLARLLAGSFGSLGLIARLAVRLHPRPAATATVMGTSADPERLATVVAALARLPLEADCIDATWENAAGRILVRFAGLTAAQRAELARSHMNGLDDLHVVTDDDALWARQRSLQRSVSGIVLKVAGRTTDLPLVLRSVRAIGGSVVARAALGLYWITLSEAAHVRTLREALAPRACTVLDGAGRVTEPWPAHAPALQALEGRIKARFDAGNVFPRVVAAGPS